ncbi:hypothetical protein [Candidatus Halobonum tyrrellensis]|uniref:Glutamate--cysteine ligase n=1 Tax=Candidatus Halobonum tyrrellensis G22 TaxID=1324957 RepID=V4HLD8_9EURY|nr:hypothetical protein [Candidatus Halobonum tyrrellensis]ESP88744.1 hypothetical protein K933_07833 [Candidatus Halobonum tyrrellensis G22]
MTEGDGELVGRVNDVLAVDAEEFRHRAAVDAETVKDELRAGTFDNHQSIVGLEYEFYAVSEGRWRDDEAEAYTLCRVPRRLLELIGFEKELGLHNAEMTTSPQPFNPDGLRAQAAEVRARLTAALDTTAAEGMRLVSDGMWTIPPAGETARGYLVDSVNDDGVRVATNMSDAVRYHAMANGPWAGDRFAVDDPHVDLSAETVMPESLITSIQPHYQAPHAADLPLYHDLALRVAGPLLALGVNSPFYPPDLYDEGVDPETVLREGRHENRVAVFESVLGGEEDATPKVSFPDDLDSVEAAVDRIAADPTVVPMPVEEGDRFDDAFGTLRRKHGTYWRWVRPVFGGATRSAANARIEFRPIPAQPTVRDSVAFLAAFAGLMESMARRRHPVADLPWTVAEENFYAAVEDGVDADLRWIATDGAETTDTDALFDDLLAHAEAGLEDAGCSETEAERYLEPLRYRANERVTPAGWKRREVRDRLDDGASFADAVESMQRRYIDEQAETLVDGQFADW